MAYTTIDDPSAYFQTTLYSGTGSTASVTNGGNSDLQPDWVWIKCRNVTRDHRLLDSTRGVQKEIVSNSSDDEYTESTGLTAFQSDGFQHGGANGYGASGENYVAWQWKANGGSTTTNDASATSVGSLDSVYQANTTAGFSIVTYTGNGNAATIAHGLGVKPECIIIKNRGKDEGWAVYHGANTSAPETDGLHLNLTNATNDSTDYWNDVAPTTTTFGISGDDRSGGGYNYIAYVFNSIQGYSKFGSYTGNGNADGTFVYTGFKPAYVMVKGSTNVSSWNIHDNKRQTFNDGSIPYFKANKNNAELSATNMDILFNGFKLRTSDNDWNGSNTYIYMAFAEHPFVSSKGVPVTAK